ncbi:MAG: tRNA guanosine(34) transglycosylase Tgt, partial [Bacteroidota bacterium]
AKDFTSLDPSSKVWVDQVYTKDYLRHLIKTGEYLGIQIATIHNLAFYLELMRVAREKIASGEFVAWKNQVVPKLGQRL